jgi:hypothetical protein
MFILFTKCCKLRVTVEFLFQELAFTKQKVFWQYFSCFFLSKLPLNPSIRSQLLRTQRQYIDQIFNSDIFRSERGSVVVKALCCKPEGRGFEIRWGEWICSINLILPAALGPGVHSASNRNEYQKQKKEHLWGIERGRCSRLTTLSPHVGLLPRQLRSSASQDPVGLHGLVQGNTCTNLLITCHAINEIPHYCK